MPPVVIAAGIATAGSLGAGAMGILGAKSAARAAQWGEGQANQTEWNQYTQNRQDQAPWYNTGAQALGTLSQLLGLGTPGGVSQGSTTGGMSPEDQKRLDFLNGELKWYEDVMAGRGSGGWTGGAPTNPGTIAKFNAAMQKDREEILSLQSKAQQAQNWNASTSAVPQGQFGSLMKDFTAEDFKTDPGYEFRLAEGQKALERSAAAKGSMFSGGTLKDLTDYNQNFASNEYSNAYNRFNQNKLNRFNMLSSLAGMGQVSANQIGQNGMVTANNIANNTMRAAETEANARASGYAALGQTIQNGANTAMNWYMLSKLGQGGSAPSAPNNWGMISQQNPYANGGLYTPTFG